MDKGNHKSCACEGCVNACKTKPGWLHPGDAERMAVHLGVSVEELFRTKLSVDWLEYDDTVFVLAPAIVRKQPGDMYPGDPRGRCVFLTEDNRCGVHGAKLFECRKTLHSDSWSAVAERHKKVADAWRQFQEQIRKLLGREPCVMPGYSPWGV